MATLKKWWAFLAHGAGALILLVNPADITSIAANHPKVSVLLITVWGWLLAWAKSPGEKKNA